MRFVECACLAVALLTPAVESRNETTLVHRQRYAMGTMFDVLVYHESRLEAERAADKALDEIERLDRVLSHFQAESDLARLIRDGRMRFVTVDPSLYEVLRESLRISRLSNGAFDVTIAPLVEAWKHARLEGRRPSQEEIARARRCVGFEKIEIREPDRVRLRSDCLGLDLGGIGKGYAVDRGLAVLRACGITAALINAGASSIAAIGSPPGRTGWPVSLGSTPDGSIVYLRDSSVSTSQQASEAAGDIINPRSAAPARNRSTVSVVAPSATLSDALSTTLLVVSAAESQPLLDRLPGVTVYRLTAGGRVQSTRAARLTGGSR